MNDDLVSAVPTKRVGKERQHQNSINLCEMSHRGVVIMVWCLRIEVGLKGFDQPGKPGTQVSEFSMNQILQNSFWQCHSVDTTESGQKLGSSFWNDPTVQCECSVTVQIIHLIMGRPQRYYRVGRVRGAKSVALLAETKAKIQKYRTPSNQFRTPVVKRMLHPLHLAGSSLCITVR